MAIFRGLAVLTAGVCCLLCVGACGGSEGPGGGNYMITQPTQTWRLQGTVSENETGKRLSSVRVEVIDGNNAGKFATTDASGSYQLTDLAEGGFSVKAAGAGHDPATQGVTLSSDRTMDFSLALASPVLFASFQPTTIPITSSSNPDYPNRLAFTLFVQESNYVDVTVQAIYYRLVTTTTEPSYWECDNAWLKQNWDSLTVPGAGTQGFRMALVYEGPVEPATLTAAVDVTDSLGRAYRVLANAKVEPRSAAGRAGATVASNGTLPQKAARRR
jgi:hypothetical protein